MDPTVDACFMCIIAWSGRRARRMRRSGRDDTRRRGEAEGRPLSRGVALALVASIFDPSPDRPDEFDPNRRARVAKVRAAGVGPARQIVRDGVQTLAHGALVCPCCDLPLWLGEGLPAAAELSCGFCDHRAPAREFLLADVYDTVANEVYLIARVA